MKTLIWSIEIYIYLILRTFNEHKTVLTFVHPVYLSTLNPWKVFELPQQLVYVIWLVKNKNVDLR